MRRSYLLYNNPLLFIILYFWEKCKCRFSEDVRRQWESILEHLILLLFERSRFSFDPSARDRIDDRDLCPRKLIAARHTRWRGETASRMLLRIAEATRRSWAKMRGFHWTGLLLFTTAKRMPLIAEVAKRPPCKPIFAISYSSRTIIRTKQRSA